MTNQPDPYLAALSRLEKGDVPILVMDQNFTLNAENRGHHIRVGQDGSTKDITVTLSKDVPKGAQFQLETNTDGDANLYVGPGTELHGWGSMETESHVSLSGRGSIVRLLVVENLDGQSAKYVTVYERNWART